MAAIQLVWYRNDLRCRDQAALAGAAEQGPVVALYCFCPGQLRAHGVGGNRVGFLLRTLAALGKDLDALGIPLRILDVDVFDEVPTALLALARELGARGLWFNDEYPLNEARRDQAVVRTFDAAGIPVHRSSDTVIRPPGSVLTQAAKPFSVFTPFRRRWLADLDPAALVPRLPPRRQAALDVRSDPLPRAPADLQPSVADDLWPAGEAPALARLEQFVEGPLGDYAEQRDLPAVDGTSTLSAWLAVGALSPRQCVHAAMQHNEGQLDGGRRGASTWMTELVWREFYRHVIAAYPGISRGQAFRREYDALPWRHDPEHLAAWREGRTGYPLVDAAMRQLTATGWMHNRLRMVVAMFLSKNLLLDWRLGEAWFMQQLVDGDFASNNGGWQWSASTGTDAVPYFRVFNPITQSRRFDAKGHFIRRYVPELAGLDAPEVHAPSQSSAAEVAYPRPIVDAKESRSRAIEVFRALRGNERSGTT